MTREIDEFPARIWITPRRLFRIGIVFLGEIGLVQRVPDSRPVQQGDLLLIGIREFSARLGLPTADKPQMACLSSRIPYGEKVTPEKLRMIEEAEGVLRDLGFHDVRVRHHETGPLTGGNGVDLPSSASGLSSAGVQYLARTEIGASELPKFLAHELAVPVGVALKRIGYFHVTLDLLGYCRGSLNEHVST